MDCSIQSSEVSAISSGYAGGQFRGRSAMRYVDLFAGLGGFHVGLSRLGMQCVFASELDEGLRDLYQRNFGIKPEGDIRLVDEKNVPSHEILCAGFPCQPFSRAGKKKGAACPASGKLINDVIRIVAHHLPSYVMLENVPNILTIQDGEFWRYVEESFTKLGYELDYRIYSPHEFGIPQRRNRVFVVASRIGLSHFVWPAAKTNACAKRVDGLLGQDEDEDAYRAIEPAKLRVLEKWQQLVKKLECPSYHLLISSEFGANYPLDGFGKMKLDQMRKLNGAFGQPLQGSNTWGDVISKLPHYVANRKGKIPDWLLESIIYSRKIYGQHSEFIDKWKVDLVNANNSWQKLEWQGARDNVNIWQHIIQFRASGIRIIRPDCAPSLVAMTPTQTPILGWKKRYMGVREAAALQSLESLQWFPEINGRAFKALGNAVNAFIVGEIANNLIC